MKCAALQRKNVLITGCSTGIGWATALYLRDRGWEVLPTARKSEDLERLAQERFHPLRLEMTDSASVQQAASEALERCDGQLAALVNNAGYGQPGAVEDLTREQMQRQFEVNVFGMQELTNALLPTFCQQGWGRVVNISSVVGRLALPFMGIYSASKFAMEALSDAMRIELRGTGVAVSLVEPGPIESAFRANASAEVGEELVGGTSRFVSFYERMRSKPKKGFASGNLVKLPPEAVAKCILHALSSPRPRSRYRVTLPTHMVAILRRLAPDSLIDALLARRVSG